MKLKILSPGPLSSIQDLGRFGYLDTGFSPNGAMDTASLKNANLLVGNAPDEGAVEMTLMGITAEFTCDTVIALTGADMEPKRNGISIPMYRSISVKRGDILSMGMAKTGLRSYLAVAGGFDLPLVMGSLSTNLKCGFGGLEGRKLAVGDEIPLKRSVSDFSPRNMSGSHITDGVQTIHVLLGPQDDYFTQKGIDTFLNTEYTVSAQSDRMGIRLDGEAIENRSGVDIISDGIVTGAVQIPNSGTPIVMMADRQTTGGYAKIATVVFSDLKRMAQLKPGSRLRFSAVSDAMAVLFRKEDQCQWNRKQLQYPTLWEK